ncbi:MAG: hypothetical protein ACR2QE_14885 [Acidimicrobiales bacterium]
MGNTANGKRLDEGISVALFALALAAVAGLLLVADIVDWWEGLATVGLVVAIILLVGAGIWHLPPVKRFRDWCNTERCFEVPAAEGKAAEGKAAEGKKVKKGKQDKQDKKGDTFKTETVCQTPWERYWYMPVGVLLLAGSAVFFVMAIVGIGNVEFDTVLPWLWLVIAVVVFLLALVAFSFAPPGPNFIEKALAIDGASVLIMIGIGMTAVGSLAMFDFGDDDAQTPSLWWTVLIVAGIVVFLVGMQRFNRPRGKGKKGP